MSGFKRFKCHFTADRALGSIIILNYHLPLWMNSNRLTLEVLPVLNFDQKPVLGDLFFHLALMVLEGKQWFAQPDI